MKKISLFIKRNLTEMVRDPLIYIFCAGMPVAMILMFQLIQHYSEVKVPVFEIKSLIPGVMMFSYSVLMLMGSLLLSKDRTSSFLKRLYTSPMKPYQYVIGYIVPQIIVGLVQDVVCIALGYIFGAVNGTGFISFSSALLLIVTLLPMMIFNILLGIVFGTLLNDKSAPGICSIFISASGVIGGAWMPVDTMGNFEKIVGYFPFYASTYLGRIVTGASNSFGEAYVFDGKAGIFLGIVFAWLALAGLLAVVVFNRKMTSDTK